MWQWPHGNNHTTTQWWPHTPWQLYVQWQQWDVGDDIFKDMDIDDDITITSLSVKVLVYYS